MKKTFLFFLMLTFTFSCFAQKIETSDVPDAVKSTFNSKFPFAKDAKWEKEDSLYNSVFLMDQTTTEAEFSANGTWLETEWEIPVQYIPKTIKKYLDSAYAGYKLKELAIKEFPTDGKQYVAEISKKKDNLEIFFTLQGVFTKKEQGECEKKGKCCKKKKSCEMKEEK